MKRYRDELFTGLGRPLPLRSRDLMQAICTHLGERDGREVHLMLEPFPADTVSGLWLDMGDYDVIAVEVDTSPLHQLVILGHELWHRHEGSPGHHGSTHHVTAQADICPEEERRAESFGRLLAAKFRPYLDGGDDTLPVGVAGRIWASLKG